MQSSEQLEKTFKSTRVIKLFTIREGISPVLLSAFVYVGHPHYTWVDTPEDAAYLVFPCDYHVAHDLPHFYNFYKGTPKERELVLECEEKIISLSKKLNKKIIIFFNSDSAKDEIMGITALYSGQQ